MRRHSWQNHKTIAGAIKEGYKMEKITVVKESGEKEDFSAQKVKGALRRAGLSGKGADDALDKLRPKLYDGITTKRIYQLVYAILDEMKPEVSHKYNLKRALFEMGPAGYVFEDFISKLLALHGYRTEIRQTLEGKCVTHEIDVIAAKDKDVYAIECKFHNLPGTKCAIQTALYVYARYLDLAEGAKLGRCRHFTRPYLVTNTKFSEDVMIYAECMDIPLLGWHYPLDKGLEILIDRSGCYPITVIPMSLETKNRLVSGGIITVFDIPESAAKLSQIGKVPERIAREIIEHAAYAR